MVQSVLIWTALIVSVSVPIGIAAGSPLLAWRDPIYVAAGFAGIVAMGLLLIQPLLAGGYLPGLHRRRGRIVHRIVGSFLVAAVLIHVGGLWLTSPPDVIDALLFASPTPFSDWGVIAMWAVFAAALIAVLRHRLRPPVWRKAHTALVVVVAIATIAHAVLIEGTMGFTSKVVLCVMVAAATVKVVIDLRVWRLRG